MLNKTDQKSFLVNHNIADLLNTYTIQSFEHK